MAIVVDSSIFVVWCYIEHIVGMADIMPKLWQLKFQFEFWGVNLNFIADMW